MSNCPGQQQEDTPQGQLTDVASGGSKPGAEARAGSRLAAASQKVDLIVVRRVYEVCQQHIAKAVASTPVLGAFLAALAANESGGKPEACCFEPKVYGHLKAVASGRTSAFGSIVWKNLLPACQQSLQPGSPDLRARFAVLPLQQEDALRAITGAEEEALRGLASSWGFTQIMGYQVIGHQAEVRDLLDPDFHFRFAVKLLTVFARRFRLRLSRDFEDLFRCWNTGQPNGKTFDPEYVAKGLRRMKLYQELEGIVSQHTSMQAPPVCAPGVGAPPERSR
ncbi:MAG TPA: hypothetical protein VFZ08_02710 [Terriglobia bacterium]|nr:hypothetical protein [Terriglobia bacterium]